MTTEPAVTVTPKRKAPRWMWIALIGSLALNCLVLGIVLRAGWQIRNAAGFGGDPLAANFAGYVNALPAERREQIGGAFLAARSELRSLRQDIFRTRHEAAQILRTEPFDKAAFTAAQSRMLDAEIKLRQAVMRPLPDLAASMSAEERRALLQWRGGRRGPGGRGLDGPDGPGTGAEQGPPGKRRP